MPIPKQCEMCKAAAAYAVGPDPKYQSRFCGPCIEARKRQGLNRVERVCKVTGCGKKFYPYAKDVEKCLGLCNACRFDDMVARGAKVEWRTTENGRNYRVAVFDGEIATRFDREDVV